MPRSRSKQKDEKKFTKRRSVEDGLKLADAAHEATWRIYCEVLRFWRGCKVRKCRRHRCCLGNAAGCLMRGLPSVPEAQRLAAAKEVMRGGPRRLEPATHLEWVVRREPLPVLTTWRKMAASSPAQTKEDDSYAAAVRAPTGS
jgi:hypothetical protein